MRHVSSLTFLPRYDRHLLFTNVMSQSALTRVCSSQDLNDIPEQPAGADIGGQKGESSSVQRGLLCWLIVFAPQILLSSATQCGFFSNLTMFCSG